MQAENMIPHSTSIDPCDKCSDRGLIPFQNDEGHWRWQYCDCGHGTKRKTANTYDKLDQRLHTAGVPMRLLKLSLETHPLMKTDSVLRSKLNDWLKFGKGESIYLWGEFGRGKTGLAAGILRECVANFWCEFITVPDLLSRLRSTYSQSAPKSEWEVISEYSNCELLVLDDFGAEHIKNADWTVDRLYQIINKRYDDMVPTIFTSNLRISDLADRIGERLVWRIIEMCGKENIIEVKGDNLRDVS